MIGETCSVCGLPKELCVCQSVEKEASIIELKVEKRKYGKLWAIISGIDVSTSDLKQVLKNIKNKMACGGTIKGKNIEVLLGRGDKTKELIEILAREGFAKDSIHVTN
jgi:translation initiation factor 1